MSSTFCPETSVSDFYRLDEQLDVYEEEIRQLVLRYTGAVDALVFDHTRRSDSPAVRERYETREAASVIHNDYTDTSARKRLEDLMPADEAAARAEKEEAEAQAQASASRSSTFYRGMTPFAHERIEPHNVQKYRDEFRPALVQPRRAIARQRLGHRGGYAQQILGNVEQFDRQSSKFRAASVQDVDMSADRIARSDVDCG